MSQSRRQREPEVDFTSTREPKRLRSESVESNERFFSVSTAVSSVFTESYSTPFEHTPPQGVTPPATTFVRRKLEDHEYELRGRIKQEEFEEEESNVDAENSVLDGLGLTEFNSDADVHFQKVLERMRKLNLTRKVARSGEHPIAFGGFGEVWQGAFGRKQVAIKVARRWSVKPDQVALKRAAREMSAWGSLRHSHVMPLFGFVIEDGGWVSLVSPWQHNGNANEFLYGKSWRIAMQVIVGACLGLRYLHNKGMIHGDFRGDNILINNEGSAVLNDFGLSRNLQSSLFKTTATPGNIRWTAPEILLSAENDYVHTYASDVWASGMTIMELFWSSKPFGNLGDGPIAIAINSRKLPNHPDPNHQPLWDICSACWNYSPDSRISMRRVVGMLQKVIQVQPPVYSCDPIWEFSHDGVYHDGIAERIPELVALLSDRNVRSAAEKAFRELSQYDAYRDGIAQSIPQLVALLSHSDWNARSEAAKTIEELSRHGERNSHPDLYS